MMTMGVDDLLFFIIMGGMVLTIAYLRDQYTAQRRYRIAERGSELRLGALYRSRSQAQFKGPPGPESSDPLPRTSRDAAPNASLPVHVRFVYRRPLAPDQPQGASEPGFCQIRQKLKISHESPITRR
jgi:hypothetical protein